MRSTLSILLTVCIHFFQAQSVSPFLISSNGSYSTTPSGSLAWSIGEPVSDTYVGPNILTKGFHQPKSIMVLGLNNTDSQNNNLYAFPSPAVNEVKLDFSGMEPGEYTIDIHDVSGKQMDNYKVKVETKNYVQVLDLSNYANAFYIFKITNTKSSATKYLRLLKQN